jgi:hypothetical protein
MQASPVDPAGSFRVGLHWCGRFLKNPTSEAAAAGYSVVVTATANGLIHNTTISIAVP